MKKELSIVYFSPTGTTKKVVKSMAKEIVNREDGINFNHELDITLPKNRKKFIEFNCGEIVVVGMPVYAGRVPNILVEYLKTIVSDGALAIPVVVYGNRNYDDALIELADILELDGFTVIAGAVFIGEHSFSKTLASGRPDKEDLKIVSEFVDKIIENIMTDNKVIDLIKGQRPYRKHYMPKDKLGELVDLRKVKPKTNEDCIDCKLCAELCPKGSINIENVKEVKGICIKCGACIKNCPVEAKYYDDENYLRHKEELELEFSVRREPELFV